MGLKMASRWSRWLDTSKNLIFHWFLIGSEVNFRRLGALLGALWPKTSIFQWFFNVFNVDPGPFLGHVGFILAHAGTLGPSRGHLHAIFRFVSMISIHVGATDIVYGPLFANAYSPQVLFHSNAPAAQYTSMTSCERHGRRPNAS